ncbi:MAG: hypothetical protein ACFB13_03750 [Kiloniellaceae bacterium]
MNYTPQLLLTAVVATLLLGAPAPAQACQSTGDTAADSATHGETCDSRREPPRIIFGESEPMDFEFREFRPLRRSDASTRQAYFGSGDDYRSTLTALQGRMESIVARDRLEALPLTPAQEAAKRDMTPALMRALTLAKKSRESTAE